MVPQEQSVKQTPAVFFTLRFRLRKVGDLQFISHLDFVRTMHKALVRSRLPMWYTLGFNPIPKITFAAPLSVGTESECELMDVRMNEPCDPAMAGRSLAAVLPPQLEVLDCYVPVTKLNTVGYIAYDVRLTYDGCDEAAARVLSDLLAAPTLTCRKMGKSGKTKVEKEVNVAPMIAAASLSYDSERGELVGRWLLSSSPSAFLGPHTVVEALRASSDLLPSGVGLWMSFVRREIYGMDKQVFR